MKVVRDYDRTLPKICARGGELNQVWTNIIHNAVDAMGGKGTLTIRTARDRDCVLVEIGDTGPGIPPELQRRIFEPFFTTKDVGRGHRARPGHQLPDRRAPPPRRYPGRVRAGRHPLPGVAPYRSTGPHIGNGPHPGVSGGLGPGTEASLDETRAALSTHWSIHPSTKAPKALARRE